MSVDELEPSGAHEPDSHLQALLEERIRIIRRKILPIPQDGEAVRQAQEVRRAIDRTLFAIDEYDKRTLVLTAQERVGKIDSSSLMLLQWIGGFGDELVAALMEWAARLGIPRWSSEEGEGSLAELGRDLNAKHRTLFWRDKLGKALELFIRELLPLVRDYLYREKRAAEWRKIGKFFTMTARIVRINADDTIIVEIQRQQQKVRVRLRCMALIPPQPTDPTMLAVGQVVRVEFAVQPRDPNGSRAAYVFVGNAPPNEEGR